MLKILLFFTIIAFVHSRFYFSECPVGCACEDLFCRRRGRGALKCSGVFVNCSYARLSSVPGGIPLNVTGLQLSNNALHQINLDHMKNFSKLTNLIINQNNATQIAITVFLKRLEQLMIIDNKIIHLPMTGLVKLKSLLHLNLQHNWIEDIRDVRFPRKLEILNLNYNRIRSLNKKSFKRLSSLRVLKLNNNRIRRLASKAFRYLSQLQSLELENNNIRKLSKNQFRLLVRGWYINLKNNEISEIHPTSFRLFGYKNENHHQIHLENNTLQFVERHTVGILIPQQVRYSVYMAGNPIFCDCNLIELRDEAMKLFGDLDRMMCDSPRTYLGISVQHLNITECCF